MSNAIGLIGGLGPGATIHYYERLAKAFAARGEHPPLVITHADLDFVLGRVAAGALDELAAYLAAQVERLEGAGASFATMGAVAPHICSAQLKLKVTLPFLDLVDCVSDELFARRAQRVAILGTQFVMESDLYGRLEGFDVVRPDADAREFVHANYLKIASAGTVAGSGADIEGVRAIAKDLVRHHAADAVILAGTELSLAFDETDCGFPALDCARAHLDRIIAWAFGEAVTKQEKPVP